MAEDVLDFLIQMFAKVSIQSTQDPRFQGLSTVRDASLWGLLRYYARYHSII